MSPTTSVATATLCVPFGRRLSMNAMSAPALRIALLGNPNCGKTALFNLLTGSRQKVANYAGVTVERKEGLFETPAGQRVRVLDLPGAFGRLQEQEGIHCRTCYCATRNSV